MTVIRQKRNPFRSPALGLALFAACLGTVPAGAQTNPVYTVDTILDAHDANLADGICASTVGGCTLRAALEQNNATPGPQGYWGMINLPAGEYLLTLGELPVTAAVSITGAGPLTTRIDGNRNRAFNINGAHISHFNNFTIYNAHSNAQNSGLAAGRGGGIHMGSPDIHLNMYRVHVVRCSTDWRGGGIYGQGSMTIMEGRFAENSAPRHDGSGVEGSGGGIWFAGLADIYRTEFTDNQGTRGGAIFNVGKMKVVNSTFSANKVTYQGGAIFNGGVSPSGHLEINFSTFTGNQSRVEALDGQNAPIDTMQGGGALFNIGTMSMGNSIVAANQDLNPLVQHKPSPDCWSKPFESVTIDPDDLSWDTIWVVPTFTSFRSNFVGALNAPTCDMRDQSWGDHRFDHVGSLASPLASPLGILGRNGGLTATHSIQAGTLVVDGAPSRSGNSVFPCPETDQRGVPRPFSAPCDIGAFELTAQTDYLEAEDGSATGAYFDATYDATASGNFYASVAANLPGAIAAPDEQQHLDLKIYVDNPGFYNIQGWVRAANIDQNSFWVKMDGQSENVYLWDLPVGGTAFQADMISDRGTGTEGAPQTDPVAFYLDKGVHTLSIYHRESGAQLDRIRVIPAAASFSTLEVEKTALMYGAFMVGDDPMAGTGQYVYTPEGSANFLTAPDDGHKITQTVTVAQAGTYLIRARVHAVLDEHNSFWVKVDGQPGNGYLWDMTESNPTYGLDYVSDRGTGDARNPQHDPVEITLSAGTHTIEVFTREAGTRLDNIGLELKTSADAKIISRNKPVTASSTQSTFTAGKAVDGNQGTRWASQAGDDQWIRIDLQARYRIHRVMLYWDAAFGKDYDIQLSEDGNTWTSYYAMRNGGGAGDNVILDGIGRYVRMKGVDQGTPSGGYSLKEFDVYGTPVAGGSGGFVCEGACLNAEPTAKYQNKVLNTTGERWYVVEDVVTGWQASETAGRQITVNGVPLQPGQMPLPARVNGKYYFRFSPGQHAWASWSFWN